MFLVVKSAYSKVLTFKIQIKETTLLYLVNMINYFCIRKKELDHFLIPTFSCSMKDGATIVLIII